MPKQQVSFSALIPYLPQGSFESVVHYIEFYKVQLTVSRQRQTILGDYRHAHAGKGHRISVNGNLNKYSFLITLLHELAHLFTYERHSHRVPAHGQEWKNEYGKILAEFLSKKIFPADVETALVQTLKNPAASSCGDEKLLRVLKNYDPKKAGHFFIEQFPAGALFKIKGDRIFKKGEKIRKRFKCREIATGKWYLFSGVYEAEHVPE
ncbi:MAG: SprT-like domain-containing protein [Ferruginibacter sp.]